MPPVDSLTRRGIPVVFVDRYLPGVPADYIGVENERGAYLATRHLIAIGARQIGVVSPGSRDTPQRERLDGYQRAVAEAGLPTIDLGKNTQPRDFHRVLTQADPPLEAIFWGSYNYLHRRFVTMLREGLDPPTNLLFAGFDSLVITASSAEEYQVAQLLVRPLPTVIQPHGELGRSAVDQLLTRLEGDRSEHVHLRLPLAYFGIEP
jgi:LacI family transcriptional regulator